MKKKLSRLFLSVLGMVAVFCVLPVINVSAEEQMCIITQNEVNVENEEYHYVDFATFEELKVLVEDATENEGYWYSTYTGTATLVIGEDITIPENFELNMRDGVELQISHGVTMVATGTTCRIYVDDMIIFGTLKLDNQAKLCVDSSLEINGKIINGGYIGMSRFATELSGSNNIEYTETWSELNWSIGILNFEELKTWATIAEELLVEENWTYSITVFLNEEYGDPVETMYISESLTIPSNVDLSFYKPVVVEEECTLELMCSRCEIYNTLDVEGTLINNSDYTNVFYSNNWLGYQAKIIVAESGNYTGNATLYIWCEEDEEYTLAVPGMNLNGFLPLEYSFFYGHYWTLTVNPFFDIPKDKWYSTYVMRAYTEGLMSGVGTDKETGLIKFAPEATIPREQFVQILYNREGKPEVEYNPVFVDVPEQSDTTWYSNAIMWAVQNDLVSGYNNGKFGVGDLITREQVAVILKKYAAFKGYDTAYTIGKEALEETFNDVEEISSWAMESLCWAVEYGVMSGKSGGWLMPLGNASRAEAATMLLNMIDSYEK